MPSARIQGSVGRQPMAFAADWQRRCGQRDRTLSGSEGFAPCPVASDAETLSITQGLWFPVDEIWEHLKPDGMLDDNRRNR